MMRTTKQRSFRELLLGLFLLSHPIPMLFLLSGVTLFTLLAAWPHLVRPVILLIVGAHMAMQCAIAMLNDYCDRRLDAASKPEKPIPRGLVTPREALVAVCLLIVCMALLLWPLPPLAWTLSLVYLGLGVAYDLRLKATPWSGLIFALAIPLIPLYAFAGVGHSVPFLIWLVPTGFFLGVALNLANSLPDIEEDAANGAGTLAVVLGVERSFLLGNALLVLSALLIWLLHLTGMVLLQPLVLVGMLVLTVLLLAAMLLFTGARKPRARRKVYFYLMTLACIVLAGGWFLGMLI